MIWPASGSFVTVESHLPINTAVIRPRILCFLRDQQRQKQTLINDMAGEKNFQAEWTEESELKG